MKALGTLIFLAIAACAVLASNSHKPFLTRIDASGPGRWKAIDEPDANPAIWPRNAQAPMGEAPANALLVPCPLTPQNLPIVEPGRTV